MCDCIFECLIQEYVFDSILHKYLVCFHYKEELAVDTGGVGRDYLPHPGRRHTSIPIAAIIAQKAFLATYKDAK